MEPQKIYFSVCDDRGFKREHKSLLKTINSNGYDCIIEGYYPEISSPEQYFMQYDGRLIVGYENILETMRQIAVK